METGEREKEWAKPELGIRRIRRYHQKRTEHKIRRNKENEGGQSNPERLMKGREDKSKTRGAGIGK